MSKIPAPNYTQIPNTLFDMLPQMGESEARVVLAIARETFGWHRPHALLSLSDLSRLTGLSRQGVINGIEAGINRNTICRTQSGQQFKYYINVEGASTQESPSELVNEVDQSTKCTSQRSGLVLVNQVDQASQRSGLVPASTLNGFNDLQGPKESIKERKKEDTDIGVPISAAGAANVVEITGANDLKSPAQPKSGGPDSLPDFNGANLSFWDLAEQVLATTGAAKKPSRAFFGKLCKDFGEEIALAAVASALQKRPAELISWIIAKAQELKGTRKPAYQRPRSQADINQGGTGRWVE